MSNNPNHRRQRSTGHSPAAPLGILVTAVLQFSGCNTAQVADPLTNTLSDNRPETQLEFWHQLTSRPITSNDEAFHGLILFMEVEDPPADYQGRMELLGSLQMLPPGFDRPANQAVLRGTLAVAITRLLEIKGGLVMRLLGPSPRYATRELQYLSLYPPSSPQQTFSGTEFVGVMGRIEDYQRITHPIDKPTIRPETPPAR